MRIWLRERGIKAIDKQIRSDAHYVEYFILGLALALFGRAFGVKMRWGAVIGCCPGLLDECMKILLPTREFELIDLIKDWIGFALAVTICSKLVKKD